jgi:hypothetical protein
VAQVGGLKCTLPKGMTNRVHTPGDMMGQENADQSTLQEPSPPTNQKRNERGVVHAATVPPVSRR